ncbi:PEGA domain-containing protein [Vitiosangium sp. GDMCC 1.1324]|uniref:PEGA domain-containing protein n=1 Tax=Vitiosangium sp. (strain GDMCC 1.1324) TaxID=2138576 RepID=UPI00130D8967|nr:PEGA domain-containing protein [Vitiosangium sp. GDMCC 1.1324]
MSLKTPLALSLALLLGTASGVSEAASRRGASTSSVRKSKKKAQPQAGQDESASEPTPAPADQEPARAADAPVQAHKPAPVQPTAASTPPPPAWAGRVAVLAVPMDGSASESASRLETGLRGELGAWTDLQWVDMAAVFPPPPPASLAQGDALFEEGKGLYDNLDPEAASKKFSEAAAFYQRHPVDTKPERLARVFIFLGASRLLNGDSAGAQEAFTHALLSAPTLQPESELFGQEVLDTFNAAKAALSRQPRGTLAVDSLPAGAQVLLHGQSLGTTPLKDVELAPGPHQVVLTLPGYKPLGTFQEVEPSQRDELRPTLEPLPELASVRALAAEVSTSKALDSDPLPPGVARIAEKLGARYVVLARVAQERQGRAEVSLYAWDVQLKNRLRGVKVNPADARERQEAVRQVHDFLTGKLAPDSSLPIALPAVVKKPWFWAAVGGVAVATTASILLATQPQKPPLGIRLGNPGAGW